MFCAECGTQVPDGAKFCFSCGKPMTGSAPDSLDVGDTVEGDTFPPLTGATTLPPEVKDGAVLRGKYDIQRELGRGGMGVVYLAHDLDLPSSSPRHAVAVKMLPPALSRNERWMKRLVAEFDAAAQLRGRHIVLVHSFSVDDQTGAPFIVMEYVEGTSLDKVLDTRGRLDEEETLQLAEAVAKGLGEAHERGLVHRDFKPGNVLVPFEGGLASAKVADFGLARMVQSGVTRLTGRGAPSGTLLYNSPEQHRGSRRLDARSDLYSFAATVYECLAGEPLVNPEGDIGWQITQEPPESIEDISPPLFAALTKALAKDKEERFGTVAAFVEALRGDGVAARGATSVEGRAPSRPVVAVRDTRERPGRDGARPSIVLPRGWTSEDRRVVVATPEGDVEKDITYYRNTIGMKFVLIPAGEFMMGSPEGEEGRSKDEGPVHKVRITRPFFQGATPVTQGQYREVTGGIPSFFRGERVVSKGFLGIGRKTEPTDLPERPVEKVSWNDAQRFLNRLGVMEDAPVRSYRLPAEAEWEYACRAGTETPYYGAYLDEIAWYEGNSGGNTHEVGRKLPNAFGLYDMTGNVWEWCQDWYDKGYYAKSPLGSNRVGRGGCWGNSSRRCRSASRGWNSPGDRGGVLGFRVARTSK